MANGEIPQSFRVSLLPNSINVLLPNDFYRYWNGLIKIASVFTVLAVTRLCHQGFLQAPLKLAYQTMGDLHKETDYSPQRPQVIKVMTWFYTVTDAISTGRQPLYFPVAIVKEWVLSFFNKVLFLDEQNNSVLADIRGKYNRNKNEYYVGKEWGKAALPAVQTPS
ncbi:hypothetical protein Fmac_031577 [Flemingia macrophylla]|uniref:Uncharacterized protein n=1 Tax=Flemingia macrophylla TaxID=520843 RepID=A0ABD1L2J5_9FABA